MALTHDELAERIPEEWVKAAEAWYSMHGSGLVRNLLAGALPLIAADITAGLLSPRPVAPVHYHWPAACGNASQGELWSGNFDRATCEACRTEAS